MSNEVKRVEISLDDKSIEILKKVNSLHRDSLINVALSLVQKTGYYKTLSGETKDKIEKLEDITSLDVNNQDTQSNTSTNSTSNSSTKNTSNTQNTQNTPKKSTMTWDSF